MWDAIYLDKDGYVWGEDQHGLHMLMPEEEDYPAPWGRVYSQHGPMVRLEATRARFRLVNDEECCEGPFYKGPCAHNGE